MISCGMLMDEVKSVCNKLEDPVKIVWMKRSMHKKPKMLTKSLQQVIDSHQDKEAILLTYGLCGNSTLGLASRHTKLVIPRFHDCIHQLLLDRTDASTAEDFSIMPGHYYMTQGWTLDREEFYKNAMWTLRRFGLESGREILEIMYDGYTDIDVIDTGAYPVDTVVKHAKKAADLLNFKVNKIPGSTAILEKLVTGNWDDDFIVLEPGEKVELSHFMKIK